MRFGLNSGPVTAGVLRGEKSRFQLFGDTVNTASRMESTGRKDMIHLSEDTANILIKRGLSSWIARRSSPVEAKGTTNVCRTTNRPFQAVTNLCMDCRKRSNDNVLAEINKERFKAGAGAGRAFVR